MEGRGEGLAQRPGGEIGLPETAYKKRWFLRDVYKLGQRRAFLIEDTNMSQGQEEERS